jgi:hypothetical protein
MIKVTVSTVEFLLDLSSLDITSLEIEKKLNRFQSELIDKSDTYGVSLLEIDINDNKLLAILFEITDNVSYAGNYRIVTLIKNLSETIYNGKK